MKERGILFSAPMVRALLAGTKTQTRRIVNMRDVDFIGGRGMENDPSCWGYAFDDGNNRWAVLERGLDERHEHGHWSIPCPYGVPGDRLWVRETHAQFSVGEGLDRTVPTCVAYRATCSEDGSFDYVNTRSEVMSLKVSKWTPSLHMPRWASRITLEVTEVRVQRLQDISEADARAEGVERDREPCDHTRRSCEDIGCLGPTHRASFCELWDSINGKKASWASNPWCWAVSFRRVLP